ncbi:MAG: hypothetical protein CMJ46_12635 [Planctomyces sp.]|nr:hypothetical protein [Planctomyces sp.]
MHIVYHLVDRDNQLTRISPELIEKFWEQNGGVPEIAQMVDDRLQLITSLLEENLDPVIHYLLDVELTHGWIDAESKMQAYQALSHQRAETRFEELQVLLDKWPMDWPTQLAVALDVPVANLNKIGLGGPLPMCDLWGISQEKLLEYFEEVRDRD